MEKKQKDTKKKPFWKKPLLITKKTVEQDLNDKDIQWVTLDLYNPYENLDGSNKTLNQYYLAAKFFKQCNKYL